MCILLFIYKEGFVNAFSDNVNVRCFYICICFTIYYKGIYDNYIYKHKHHTHRKPTHLPIHTQ